MTEVLAEETKGREERPDPAGIVLRGNAAEFARGCVERYGEPPKCWVGKGLDGVRCERPAMMEVYGLAMCEAHGEEAAAGALEEIAYDLEQELQRPMNPYVKSLSPHLEAALRHGFDSLSEEAENTRDGRRDGDLLRAFPLDRNRVCVETLAHVEDPDANGRGMRDSPFDAHMAARMLLHKHMRLAFQEDASWLVETLEAKRESVAAQAAYALALDKDADRGTAPAV